MAKKTTMELIQNSIDFVAKHEFLFGFIAGSCITALISWAYITWHNNHSISIKDIVYQDLLTYVLDKNQPVSFRIKLLHIYAHHPQTTLQDLYTFGYDFPDFALEKHPKALKIIMYARKQVQKHKAEVRV